MEEKEPEQSNSKDEEDAIKLKGVVQAREILETGKIPEPEEPEPTQLMEVVTGELPLHWTDPPTGEIPEALKKKEIETQEEPVEDEENELLQDLPPARWRQGPHDWISEDEDRGDVTSEQVREDEKTNSELEEPKVVKVKDLLAKDTPDNQTRKEKKPSDVLGRVLTGIVFAALTGGCLLLGPVAMLMLVIVIALISLSEFYSTLNKRKLPTAGIVGLTGTVGAILAAYFKGANGLMLITAVITFFTLLWYLPSFSKNNERPLAGSSFSLLGFYWIGFSSAFAALIISPHYYPNRHGIAYITGALLFAILSDTGAYFVGTFFKRRQLKTHSFAKKTSPSKTVEGLIGGLVLALISSFVLGRVMYPWTESKAFVASIAVSIATILGDLIESMIKRDLNIKDMGSLLPGHGGLLDRVDGILFAMPVMYYMLQILHMS